MLIHDTQYDAGSYPAKVGWGHSPMEYAVALAAEAGVRRLVLFHHDPARDDAAVDALLARARAGRGAGRRLEVDAAAEGAEIVVVPGGAARSTDDRGATATEMPALEHLTAGVVVSTSDPALEATVRAAAAAEGLEVRSAEETPADDRVGSVMVVDVDDEQVDTPSGSLAVLGATRRAIPNGVSGITDWLVLPCSIAHVRTKLRAAVLRRACRWLAAPAAPDEEQRLASLHALGVLDTPPETRFDELVELARRATETPIALITLVDAERQWFKAHAGFDATESHRDESFCAHAVLGDGFLQVPDALEDDRFAENPAVAGPTRVRFYAGVGLALADGSCVGTLCVADHRPRLLDDHQLTELRRWRPSSWPSCKPAACDRDARLPCARGPVTDRDVDGVRRLAAGVDVGERHHVGLARCEHLGHDREEVVVGRGVGPQREHATRVEAVRQALQARRLVEGGVARVEDVPRRVIDVDEDGVEALRCRGPERRARRRPCRRSRRGRCASADRRRAPPTAGAGRASCQSITSVSASTTCSDRTRSSSSTARAV